MPCENDYKCFIILLLQMHNTVSLCLMSVLVLFIAPFAYHSANSEASEQDFPMASPAEEVGA